MKVLLFNGSPNEKGCTYTALSAAAEELQSAGIETEIFYVNHLPMQENVGLGYKAEAVTDLVEKIKDADGFIFGSPVHYAGVSAIIKVFMDYMFWRYREAFSYKPGAVIVSCRRAGTSAALEQIEKHIQHNNMPLVSSCYWNMVHGNSPEEVAKDEEGVQIVRTLGKNMAWLLKCIEAGNQAGITHPEKEKSKRTNFIRND